MKFILLTSASSNHYKSVCQLFSTVPSSIKVIFYDIGLSEKERETIILQYPSIDVRIFDFSKYPSYIHLTSPYAGAYAWKPIIIYDVFSDINEGILLWCDAGNKLDNNVNMLKSIIQTNKIYTPFSVGSIRQWCHPSSLQSMNVPDTMLRNAMRDAACVGMLCGDKISAKFVKEWKECALQKDTIIPEGSTLGNHRFDQSLLSCLFYKYNIRSVPHFIGVTTHNDIG